MVHVSGFGLFRHLLAGPNQHILHFKKGKLALEGAGLSYWFNPLNAAVAMVPVEDCETTFLLREKSHDFQEVSVQLTVTYRMEDPEKAAARVNFSISLASGEWTEQPLDRLASILARAATPPTRAYLAGAPIAGAIRGGADAIRQSVEETLSKDVSLAGMGLTVVSVQVVKVSASAELEKALQTPTREEIQQKADEAVFSRRALAVEKERAIQENELATEIELARRQEDLIPQQGKNRLLEIERETEAEKVSLEADLERKRACAESRAKNLIIHAESEATATRLGGRARADAEAMRVEVWEKAPARVSVGLALQKAAKKISKIQHLSLTPDILGKGLEKLLLTQAEA